MDREWIEELLAKTDIVNLISKYVRIEKKGSDYWACCPFHHEKTPSFKIYESTNSYHCFGCKASGNAISFLSKIESIEKIDAIKLLAEDAGMQLPKQDKGVTENEAELAQKKERLFSLLLDSARFYHDNLQSKAGENYKRYLIKRGVDERLIKKFGIGASLDWTGLIKHLESLGYTTGEMKDASVAGIGEDGAYDTFKGRITFPIINALDKVASFSGRVIENDTSFAKYKNGAQTLVFDKSKTLFGINLLKKKKRSGGKIDYVILVEGHLDTVMMHGAGFDTTVASMGTAFTHGHAKQLRNYAEKVYISYDGDTAGSKATLRGLDILASVGINVRVISLPSGMDPDDVIKQKGADYYKKLMDEAQTLTEYKINALQKQFDIEDADGKSKFAVSAVKIIKSLSNPIEREEYLKQISRITGYTMSALKKQADITEEEYIVPVVNLAKVTEERSDKACVYVLAYIAANKPIPDDTEIEDALDGVYLDIYKHIKERGISTIYSYFDEDKSTLIGEILSYNFEGFDDCDGFVKHINSLTKQKIMQEKEALSKEYEKTKDQETLKRILSLDKRLKQTKFGGR